MPSVFDPHHQVNSIDSKIVASMERLGEAFRILLWEEHKKHHYTPMQIKIMIHLLFQKADTHNLAHLSQALAQSKAVISEALQDLEEKKLVLRTSDALDPTQSHFSLTEQGQQVAQQVAVFANDIAAHVAVLPLERKVNLLEELLQVIYQLQQTGLLPVGRMCLTCRHFSQTTPQGGYYCNLVNAPLSSGDLRFHCPEHEAKSA